MAVPITSKVCVIAEAGVNHNGSVQTALELIDVAAHAGADVVKFQTFKANMLAVADAPKAQYQLVTTQKAESQKDMLRSLELEPEDYIRLAERCAERGIEFMSTPFDVQSMHFLLSETGMKRVKLPSGEITNGPFLLEAAKTGRDLILSTGMATMNEIEDALSVLAFGFTGTGEPSPTAFRAAFASKAGHAALAEKVAVLHCTTEYPAPLNEVNLLAMDAIGVRFGLRVGYSDHTEGILASVAAAACGAAIIEKHVTLDRSMPGPDHAASIEPDELQELVYAVRLVSSMRGDGVKSPMPAEIKNIDIARRSLVATRKIRKGELFGVDNVGALRPGGGMSPMRYWDIIGEVAQHDFDAEEKIRM